MILEKFIFIYGILPIISSITCLFSIIILLCNLFKTNKGIVIEHVIENSSSDESIFSDSDFDSSSDSDSGYITDSDF